jgi:hypothetical protein
MALTTPLRPSFSQAGSFDFVPAARHLGSPVFGHMADKLRADRQDSSVGPRYPPRFVRIDLKRKKVEIEERVGAVPDSRVSLRRNDTPRNLSLRALCQAQAMVYDPVAGRVFAVVPELRLSAAALAPPIATFERSRSHAWKEGLVPSAQRELVEIPHKNGGYLWIVEVWLDFARPIFRYRIIAHQMSPPSGHSSKASVSGSSRYGGLIVMPPPDPQIVSKGQRRPAAVEHPKPAMRNYASVRQD